MQEPGGKQLVIPQVCKLGTRMVYSSARKTGGQMRHALLVELIGLTKPAMKCFHWKRFTGFKVKTTKPKIIDLFVGEGQDHFDKKTSVTWCVGKRRVGL